MEEKKEDEKKWMIFIRTWREYVDEEVSVLLFNRFTLEWKWDNKQRTAITTTVYRIQFRGWTYSQLEERKEGKDEEAEREI